MKFRHWRYRLDWERAQGRKALGLLVGRNESYADAVKNWQTHWRYSDLPKKAIREMAKRDWKLRHGKGKLRGTIRQRSDRLNRFLVRYGRPDLKVLHVGSAK